MTERLVVCFRSPELVIEPRAYLAGAHSIVERAAAMGGRLISWGATVYAFSFETDALQDGIELARRSCAKRRRAKSTASGSAPDPSSTRKKPPRR